MDANKEDLAKIANLLSRRDEDVQKAYMNGRDDTLLHLIPVLDSAEAVKEHENVRDITELRVLYRQLLKQIEEAGMVTIGEEGDPFDPGIHEVAGVVESPDATKSTLKKVLTRGYTTRDGRVLRAARAIVEVPGAGSKETKKNWD